MKGRWWPYWVCRAVCWLIGHDPTPLGLYDLSICNRCEELT